MSLDHVACSLMWIPAVHALGTDDLHPRMFGEFCKPDVGWYVFFVLTRVCYCFVCAPSRPVYASVLCVPHPRGFAGVLRVPDV